MTGGRRFRLGILALIAGSAFFGLLGFVLQGVLGNDHVKYYILFEENVKGMVIGSKVNFQGVPIGMVKDIRFQDGKTMVELSVDPERADIQDITRARLDRLLVTGQVTVELEGYGSAGKPIRPGQFIKPKADPINQLKTTIPELVPQITDLLARLDVTLTRANDVMSDENRRHIAAILENADTTMAALPAAVEQGKVLMTRADSAVQALERAAIKANDELMPATQQAIADARAVMSELQLAVEAGQGLLAGLRSPVQAALASARGSLDELRGFARQLRLAPDSLLFGVSRPASPAGGGR